MNRKIELLSPAGDMDSLIAAVDFGADAVYLGSTEFSMRASPKNFTFEQMKSAVDFAHSRRVKIYLTCNTLPRNNEIDRLPFFLEQAAKCNVDAFIISDMGVLDIAKKAAPHIDIHISTQAGVVNYAAANTLYKMGVKRIVIARELSLEEIKGIREKVPDGLELEVFVHGAMCVSFSGRCLISSYLTGRDANRGDCAQPCRWKYTLVEEKRSGEYFPVVQDESGTFFFNSKDLCMIEHIDDLYKAGVTSFKIEGRAKSNYYVATVTNAYRRAIDIMLEDPDNFVLPSWLKDEVNKVSHRAYSTGFFYGRPQQIYESSSYMSDFELIAVVEGYIDGKLHLWQRNRFYSGETAEVLEPGSMPYPILLKDLYDGEGNKIEVANKAAHKVIMPYHKPIKKGSFIRRKKQEIS